MSEEKKSIYDLDDMGAVLNCAVRYCLGRQTYMPSLVASFIQRHPEFINAKTKAVMLNDIREADFVREATYADGKLLRHDGLGDPFVDRPMWLKFEEWLKKLEV